MNICILTVKIISKPQVINNNIIVLLVELPNSKKNLSFYKCIIYTSGKLYKDIYNFYHNQDFCIIQGFIEKNINKQNNQFFAQEYKMQKYLCLKLISIQPYLHDIYVDTNSKYHVKC